MSGHKNMMTFKPSKRAMRGVGIGMRSKPIHTIYITRVIRLIRVKSVRDRRRLMMTIGKLSPSLSAQLIPLGKGENLRVIRGAGI